ncbi:MAG: DNA-binding protein [Thiobacillus sp.]|nr:DNA-binding protein [Thiobacillus sp.]
MVREATITQEDVNAAAVQIRSSGKKPTARAIREILGRGSMATVLTCLHVWQDNQIRSPESPVVLPQALLNALVVFISQEIASAKSITEVDLLAVRQENADLIVESERQAETIEAYTQEVESLVAKQAELSGRMNQLTADLEISRKEAKEQRQAAEQARTEQAKLQLRLESLPQRESDIKGLKETLETERAARVKSDQDAAVAMAKLEKTEAQVEDLNIRLARADAEATQAGDTVNALWGQLLGAKASVT